MHEEYSTILSLTDKPVSSLSAVGTTGNFMAGRISFHFGLNGPSICLDTACSSSLVAIHIASVGIRRLEHTLALAAGCNLLLSPETMSAICRLQALSLDGRCKSFEASSDGYGRGEAVAVSLIGQVDGYSELGMVKINGTCMNHVGRSSALTSPNGRSQIKLIQDCLESINEDGCGIGSFVVHGTGTALGDPIEVNALAHCFVPRRNSIALQSIKTQTGHTEGAAGITGLLQAGSNLTNSEIYQAKHIRHLNPLLIESLKGHDSFTVPRINCPSTNSSQSMTSSFGMSGTNAAGIVSFGDQLPEPFIGKRKQILRKVRLWPLPEFDTSFVLSLQVKLQVALKAKSLHFDLGSFHVGGFVSIADKALSLLISTDKSRTRSFESFISIFAHKTNITEDITCTMDPTGCLSLRIGIRQCSQGFVTRICDFRDRRWLSNNLDQISFLGYPNTAFVLKRSPLIHGQICSDEAELWKNDPVSVSFVFTHLLESGRRNNFKGVFISHITLFSRKNSNQHISCKRGEISSELLSAKLEFTDGSLPNTSLELQEYHTMWKPIDVSSSNSWVQKLFILNHERPVHLKNGKGSRFVLQASWGSQMEIEQEVSVSDPYHLDLLLRCIDITACAFACEGAETSTMSSWSHLETWVEYYCIACQSTVPCKLSVWNKFNMNVASCQNRQYSYEALESLSRTLFLERRQKHAPSIEIMEHSRQAIDLDMIDSILKLEGEYKIRAISGRCHVERLALFTKARHLTQFRQGPRTAIVLGSSKVRQRVRIGRYILLIIHIYSVVFL